MSDGKDARERVGAAVRGDPGEVGCARIGVAGARRPESIRDAEFGLGVTLPNGIALNFRLPSVRALPPLLAELS